jgi:hypothetical protein
VLDVANSKSIGSATRLATGRFCLVLASGVVGKSAVATIGQSGYALSADVGFATSSCPSGIEVRTFDGYGTFADNDFNIQIN